MIPTHKILLPVLSVVFLACATPGEVEPVGERSSALTALTSESGEGEGESTVRIVYHRHASDVTLKRGQMGDEGEREGPDGMTTGEDGPPDAADDFADAEGDFKFVLSTARPRKELNGNLEFSHPDNAIAGSSGDGVTLFSHPGGYEHEWSHKLVIYKLHLDASKTYDVKICTHNPLAATPLRHEILDNEILFDAPMEKGCQIEVGLDPQESGWIYGRIGFASELPSHFHFDRVEVVASDKP